MKDFKALFQALRDHSTRPQTTLHRNFVRNRSVRGAETSNPLGMFTFSFTNCGKGQAVQQGPLLCSARKRKALLDAQMGHIMACLQVCPQHTAERKMYTPSTGGRALVTSKDCLRQKLHIDFQNHLWIGEEDGDLQGAED